MLLALIQHRPNGVEDRAYNDESYTSPDNRSTVLI